MDLIQKIKEQGNQASVLLPDVAASNEVITVDITGCTNYDDEADVYHINDSSKKEQILDWAIRSKAKFLRLTFNYNNGYNSVLFTKDAITDIKEPASLDYTKARYFSIESFITIISGGAHCYFDLRFLPFANSVHFYVINNLK